MVIVMMKEEEGKNTWPIYFRLGRRFHIRARISGMIAILVEII